MHLLIVDATRFFLSLEMQIMGVPGSILFIDVYVLEKIDEKIGFI